MEMLKWIDKNLDEIKGTLLFGKYFDSILLDEGINVYYLLNPQFGIDIILRENYSVKSIHFYSGSQKGVKVFPDTLPFDLEFSFSKEYCRKLFGVPRFTGGGDSSILYGVTPFWDKYQIGQVSLHLQYSKDLKMLDLVTIESLESNS